DQVVRPIDLTAVDVRTIHPALTAEDCSRSMHIVTRQGVVKSGFDAVTALGSRLPLFWLPSVVGMIPGVASAGRLVYNRLAATRPRDFPCSDDVCGLHSRTSPGVPRDRGDLHHHNLIAPKPDTEEMVHP